MNNTEANITLQTNPGDNIDQHPSGSIIQELHNYSYAFTDADNHPIIRIPSNNKKPTVKINCTIIGKTPSNYYPFPLKCHECSYPSRYLCSTQCESVPSCQYCLHLFDPEKTKRVCSIKITLAEVGTNEEFIGTIDENNVAKSLGLISDNPEDVHEAILLDAFGPVDQTSFKEGSYNDQKLIKAVDKYFSECLGHCTGTYRVELEVSRNAQVFIFGQNWFGRVVKIEKLKE